jgi:6-phosphogluconolactonase
MSKEVVRKCSFGRAEVEVYGDAEAAAKAAVEWIVASYVLVGQRTFRMALAGGTTPKLAYASLAGADLQWTGVEVFFSDERAVPPQDPASNFRMVDEVLLSRVSIPKSNVHRMQGELGAERAAEVYERELGTAPCDLVVLGMGDDGHTASLFPGSPALAETERRVVAAPSPVPPLERVTFTFRALDEARLVLFLITGRAKAERVAGVLSQIKQGTPELPAARVQPMGEPMFILDEDAASRLPAGDS